MKKAVKYLIEAVIILAIVAVGIYAYSIIGPKMTGGSGYKDVELTVEFSQIKKEFVEDINVGDKVFENTKQAYFGDVIDVTEIEDSVVLVKDYEKGEYVELGIDMYHQRSIKVKAKAAVSESAVKINDVAMKIGNRIGLIFNGTLVDGTIMKINIID